MDLEKDAKGLLDREENRRVYTDGDRTSKRSFIAETEGSKIEDDVLWPSDASKRYGKGYDAGVRRGKRGRPRKKWMEEIHTMSGVNLAELRWKIGTCGEN